jgi:hypothetical protein
MKSTDEMIRDYVKELLSTWWSRCWLLLSVGSTIATYIVGLNRTFTVYWWIPFSISVVAWFELYRRKQEEIKRLNKELELEQQDRGAFQAEELRRASLDRFQPRHRFEEHEGKQYLILESGDTFDVNGMKYLNADGAAVFSQDIKETGKIIQIAIDYAGINEIRRIGPFISTYDLSANMALQIHILKGGLRKDHVIKAVVKPDLRGTVRITG